MSKEKMDGSIQPTDMELKISSLIDSIDSQEGRQAALEFLNNGSKHGMALFLSDTATRNHEKQQLYDGVFQITVEQLCSSDIDLSDRKLSKRVRDMMKLDVSRDAMGRENHARVLKSIEKMWDLAGDGDMVDEDIVFFLDSLPAYILIDLDKVDIETCTVKRLASYIRDVCRPVSRSLNQAERASSKIDESEHSIWGSSWRNQASYEASMGQSSDLVQFVCDVFGGIRERCGERDGLYLEIAMELIDEDRGDVSHEVRSVLEHLSNREGSEAASRILKCVSETFDFKEDDSNNQQRHIDEWE